MGMHTAHHMHHHAHHGYKVPRIYFKIPRVLPYKEQKEKFETDDYFKKLARESEVKIKVLSPVSLVELHQLFDGITSRSIVKRVTAKVPRVLSSRPRGRYLVYLSREPG